MNRPHELEPVPLDGAPVAPVAPLLPSSPLARMEQEIQVGAIFGWNWKVKHMSLVVSVGGGSAPSPAP